MALKIAFYAPLKSPNHPRPSGDRRIAQLFIEALELAGCEVELASELRAWEGNGDPRRQAEIKAQGLQTAARLIAKYRKQPAADRPRFWFTYHLYHKAPDWLGPAVSAALGIPYVIAEASVARKQRHGPWCDGYDQALAAVRWAELIFNLNSNDLAGLRPFVRHPHSVIKLKPFTDIPATGDGLPELADKLPDKLPDRLPDKLHVRRDLAARRRIDADKYWLLCVAMMRNDSKLDSYRILADTTAHLERRDWQLLVAGDGPAEQAVLDLFSLNPPGQVHFLGRLDADFIHPLMRASDLFVWPAQNEAFGMAVLEALGCGLPVVAGHNRDMRGGIADIVAHAVTGILIAQPDGRSMAAEIEKLLAAPATLEQMSAASLATFNQSHRLDHAAKIIGVALANLVD